MAKNRPFRWPPRLSGGGGLGTTKKEKTIGKKGKYEHQMKKNEKKHEKKNTKKKTRSVLRVLDFSKMG